ncbi:ribosome-recycling factor [Enterobacteriaceae endosymbiont of Macroplea appendiculata]|uniref:ribosome-recycling factor n=1 Tax=Enterobacteriaceae endosymbiont of Macroplea appendiculata TaxID=2675790 RepID=UPI001449DA37|nr:ribosome recycling factor [Enterobacteriaceae endosymbiont of Macroplea appendiculata]QJC30842.1 ribosome recycling factor [Enterobacteriaceae endosymbiont of Macroplea appendiculata]
MEKHNLENVNMYNDIIKNNEQSMQQCFNNFKNKINIMSMNRVTPQLLEHVVVTSVYNKTIPIHHIATIIVHNVNTLKVTPFDKKIIKNIEKAILTANLDVSTQIINLSIYITMPIITESRKIKLLQRIKTETELFRICIRTIRRKTNNKIKLYLKNKEISENVEKKLQHIIQKHTVHYITCISNYLKQKEKDILQY